MEHHAHRIVRVICATLVALLLGSALAAPADASVRDRVRPTFFGVDLTIGIGGPDAWPEIAPGAVRVGLAWTDIERERGDFQWALTDAKVAQAEENGAKPLIVFQNTPRFHALAGSDGSVASAPRLSAYDRFVRRFVSRYGIRVDYQVWNEPNVPLFYTGTPAHMGRMTRILHNAVRDLAPSATVVAPSFTVRYDTDRAWFRRYWSQRLGSKPVADFVDVANLSAYPLVEDGPEQGIALTQWVRRAVAREGFDGPLWASEINYGANGLDSTPRIPARRQVAFVVQTYVLHANVGADRVYWWQWVPHQTVNTELQDGRGNLTRAGIAYGVVKDWLVGTKPAGCTQGAGLQTCRFRARDGVDRLVVWSRSGERRPVRAPTGAVTRTSSSGVVREIEPGQFFRVGRSPVMIEVTRG